MKNICYLICLRHLTRSGVTTNRIFYSKKTIFLHVCASCFESPSNISAKGSSIFKFFSHGKYPEPDPDPALGPEADPEREQEPDPDLEPVPEQEPDPKPDLKPDKDRERDPDPEPDPIQNQTRSIMYVMYLLYYMSKK